MIKLDYSEISLLRHILTTTGDTELSPDGKEGLSPRRLNGEDSSQRRWYTKATKEVADAVETKVKEMQEAHNALVEKVRTEYKEKLKKEDEKKDKKADKKEKTPEEVKLEKEMAKVKEDAHVSNDKSVKDSLKSTKEEIEKLFEEKYDIDLSDKTIAFVKKIFTAWGDNPGWLLGDDASVAEITETLK